jgi:hypothetical protein
MRYLVVILLISAFLGKSLLFMGWEIWFKLDQKRIAEEKCINKSRPMLNCNGQCYLAKQLRKIELEETKKSSTNKDNPYLQKVDVQYLESTKIAIISEVNLTDNNPSVHFYYSLDELSSLKQSVFHPPC